MTCRSHSWAYPAENGHSSHDHSPSLRSARGEPTSRHAPVSSGDLNKTQLLQRGNAVVQSNFLKDLAVLQLENCSAGEAHRAPCIRGQRPCQKVRERWPAVRAAAVPAADDVVTFCDEICSAPEVEIGEGFAEIGHEGLDVFPSTTRFVQRILEEHVRCSKLVNNSRIKRFTPELREPATNDGFVLSDARHSWISSISARAPLRKPRFPCG